MTDLDKVVQQFADSAPAILDVYRGQTAVPPSKWPRELERYDATPWADPVVAEVRAHEVAWALSVGQQPKSFEDFARQSAILMREGMGEQFEGLAFDDVRDVGLVFRGNGDTIQVQEVEAAEIAAVAQKAMQIANGEEPRPDLEEFTPRGLPVTLDLGDA